MFIDSVPEHIGREIEIKGWVYRKRESKDVVFLVMRDSEDIVQCVVKDTNKKVFEKPKKLTIESSAVIRGFVKEESRAPTGYEIEVKDIDIVHIAERFPITKDKSYEFLLDVRHLWLRSRYMNAIMKVRHSVIRAFREFYYNQGFYEMPPPILTPNACEGGATLFKVDYYGKPMYLTQSWQLYGEAAIFSIEKLFCISPCFRACLLYTSPSPRD